MGYKSGHGAEFAIQLVADIGTSTFTVLGQLTTDIVVSSSRATTDLFPHEEGVKRTVVSPVINYGMWSFSGVYDPSVSTHAHTTGLQAHFHGTVLAGTANTFATRYRGEAGVLADDGTDEVIASGQLSRLEITNGTDATPKGFTADFQVSGPVKVDSVIYS